MRTKYKTSDPIEFTRPAHDNIRDAEWGSRTRVDTTIFPASQKGVLVFQTDIRDADGAWHCKPVARLSETWPNAQAMTWEAFWFQHTNKVCRMAQDWRADREKENAAQQG